MINKTIRAIGFVLVVVATSLTAGCGTDAPFDRGFDFQGDGLVGPNIGEATFARTVRPILNRCTACHAAGAGGWTYDGGAASYGAVIDIIDRDDAVNSPLLIKATGGDGHGGGSIFSAASDDYAAIIAWIEAGAQNN